MAPSKAILYLYFILEACIFLLVFCLIFIDNTPVFMAYYSPDRATTIPSFARFFIPGIFF